MLKQQAPEPRENREYILIDRQHTARELSDKTLSIDASGWMIVKL